LLLAVLGVEMAAMVLGMPVALFPELARHTYGDAAGGGPMLGLLYAAYPIGVFLAGFFSGTFTGARHPGRTMGGAVIAWGSLSSFSVWPATSPWHWSRWCWAAPSTSS
jgi:hypothetical protein